MPASRTTHRLPHGRGAISWVTAVMLLALALGAYLAWVWFPIWMTHYDVKAVVQEYANLAIHNPSDGDLRERMAKKIESLEYEQVLLDNGTVGRQPAIRLAAQDVTWERENGEAGPVLHVAFEYQRRIFYPFVKAERIKTMTIDLRLDLSRPDWGTRR